MSCGWSFRPVEEAMRLRHAFRWVLAAGLGLPLGCLHTQHVDLRYPPIRLQESPAGLREDEAAAIPGTPVRVEPIGDLRDDRSSLGGEYHTSTSGCGGSTYSYRRLRTDDDVAGWVTNALRQDLQRAGYAVISGNADEADPARLIVDGEIIRVDCATFERGTTSLATVVLAIRARRGTEVVLNEWFQGRVPPGGSSRGLAQALSEANSSFLRQLKERTRIRK